MDDLDPELLLEFKTEAEEHLRAIEPGLLEMEGARDDRRVEIVNGLFRAIHSVKGASGFFGLTAVQELSHAMEGLMMRVRDGQLAFQPAMTDALLAGVDKLSQLVGALPQKLELDTRAEREAVLALTEGAAPAAAEPPPAAAGAEHAAVAPAVLDVPADAVSEARRFGQRVYCIAPPADRLASEPEAAVRLRAAVAGVGEIVAESADGRSFALRTVLPPALLAAELGLAVGDVSELSVPPAAGAAAPPSAPAPAADEPPGAVRGPRSEGVESVRVNVHLLDRLMDLAGELVLARNQLLRGDGTRPAVLQDLDLITSDLQREVMRTRLQPIGTITNKFSRIVRDLSRKLGKQVRLELEGSDVELDKSIVELLSDPLTHLIRNALDHGIEQPERRTAAGKPVEGVVRLSARHEGGQVHITIADDGRGIDAAVVRRVAVERGLLGSEAASALSDREAIALIFEPGFSTAEKVTDVSGRGVGMDVVRTNVSKLGGKIDLDSTPGAGSVVTIRLPLTLAIVPALIAGLGEERFAIPQVNLVELVRVRRGGDEQLIVPVGGVETLRLRGTLLPLVRLSEVLGRQSAGAEQPEIAQVVVLRVGETRFGLVVDRVLDSEEIVVKPLSRLLDGCGIYAGATILGDGRVAMILDAAGIAGLALPSASDPEAASPELRKTGSEDENPLRRLVLFTNSRDEQFAVDLERLVRLERVERAQLETLAGRRCMQYRGRGLPIVTLDEVVPAAPIAADADPLFVLIPRGSSDTRGILAERIIDTVETRVSIERENGDPEVIVGRAVVAGRLTLVIDPTALSVETAA